MFVSVLYGLVMVEPLSYERLSATTLAFMGDGNRSAASGKQSRKETFIVATRITRIIRRIPI